MLDRTILSSVSSDPIMCVIPIDESMELEGGNKDVNALTTGLQIMEEVLPGVFALSIGGKEAQVSLEILQNSLAGRIGLSQFQTGYRWSPWKWIFWNKWTWRDKNIESLRVDKNATGESCYLTGCLPELLVTEEALEKNWSGRLLLIEAKCQWFQSEPALNG